MSRSIHDKNWEKNFDLLTEYIAVTGVFPKIDTSYKDRRIGKWLMNQRYLFKRGKLDEDRIKKLEELDFLNVKYKAKNKQVYKHEIWDEKFDLYCQFLKEYERQPKYHEVYKDVKIGIWYASQRRDYIKDKLHPDRYEKLKETGFFEHEEQRATWEKRYALLLEFLDKYNRFPKQQEVFEEFKIGIWCSTQKRALDNKTISEERYKKLEKIGFWKNHGRDAKWYSKYQLVCQYMQETGKFPTFDIVFKGVEIGAWCQLQRVIEKQGKMPEDRYREFDKIGFWDKKSFDELWNEKYELLRDFIKSYDRLPRGNEEYKGVKIGQWIGSQRTAQKRGKMSEERYRKLELIGFWKTSKSN